MKCPKCDSTLPSKANFCPYCGHQITEKDRNDFLDEMIKNPQMEGEAPNFETDYEPTQVPEGSWLAGIALGFLLSVFGIMIAIATRGRNTKRGSGIGFLINAGMFILWMILHFTGVISF